ncbi:MAG TPA: hypothetical protein VN181_15465, partial [Thermoanaerobaculia bacterium]|nr:hypothetical protein [Thermoanaerobaculia bacterium]
MLYVWLNTAGSDVRGLFHVFALLPPVVAILYHIATQRRRYESEREEAKARMERAALKETRAADALADEELDRYEPSFGNTLSGATILYAVFVSVAFMAVSVNAETKGGALGYVFAGYGAYVSLLWYMLARINANALSTRFL